MIQSDQNNPLGFEPQVLAETSQWASSGVGRQLQFDGSIFSSIEGYLQKHCCLKFLLFLMVSLLVVAIYQEEGYLIKKQRTFNFFIDKIQKEKIKKELISENQQQPRPPNPNPTPPTHTQEQYSSSQGIGIDKVRRAVRWRNLKGTGPQVELARQEEAYFQQKYAVSGYEELPFCVVVPTYNNAGSDRHISNIQTILMQNYRNYRIVVIDDASTDGTGQQLRDYLEGQSKLEGAKVAVVANKQREGSARNIRKAAVEHCQPEEIVAVVDGDDELIGRQVLKVFNAVYQETGAWVVYSSFLTQEGQLGYSRPYPKRVVEGNLYRQYPFVASHLRTAYAELLRGLREEDLLDEKGGLLVGANDVSFMLPCLEMAHRRVAYLPELTYLYNPNTGLNVHHLDLPAQKRNERMIRRRKAYPAVESLKGARSGSGSGREPQWLKEMVRVQEESVDLGDVSDHIWKATP